MSTAGASYFLLACDGCGKHYDRYGEGNTILDPDPANLRKWAVALEWICDSRGDFCGTDCEPEAIAEGMLPVPVITGQTEITADPDLPCDHINFEALVIVNRIQRSDDDPTVVGYNADITVACAGCGEPFRWTGVAAGMSPGRPMCSVDGTELRAPLRPASSDPDFGLGLPGFSVKAWTEDAR